MGAPRTPALPGVLRGTTALVLTCGAIALWRFGGFPIAAAGAALALVVSWRAGEWLHGDRRWVAAFAAVPAAVALLLVLARSWPAAWPCDIACQGGARYADIHGLALPVIACVGWVGLLLAVGATRWAPPQIEHRRSAPTPRYLELLVWIAIGASLFFVWTAWRLRMPCSACGAYHTAALSVGGTLRAGRLRLGPRWLALIAGATAPMLIFGWHLLRDVEPAAPPGIAHTATDWAEAAARGLTWGDPGAPCQLELGLDAQCPRCADEFASCEDAFEPLIRGRSMRLRIRLITRPSEAAGPTLDAWIYTAAERGHARQALHALLGMRPETTVAEALRSPGAELIDLPRLSSEAEAHQAESEALRRLDQAMLSKLGFGGMTPFAALCGDDGAVLARWSGRLDPGAMAAAIREHGHGGSHD